MIFSVYDAVGKIEVYRHGYFYRNIFKAAPDHTDKRFRIDLGNWDTYYSVDDLRELRDALNKLINETGD